VRFIVPSFEERSMFGIELPRAEARFAEPILPEGLTGPA
jgi:hypothetical protein